MVAADATPVQSHIVSAALTPQPQARPSAGLLISALGVENQPAPSASGQFQGAHNFTIQDSVFAERIEIFQSGAMGKLTFNVSPMITDQVCQSCSSSINAGFLAASSTPLPGILLLNVIRVPVKRYKEKSRPG